MMVVDAEKSEVEEDWQAPVGRQRKHRRRLRLRGGIAPGSSLKEGGDVYLAYDYPPPFGPQRGAAPGARGAMLVKILELHDDGVTIEETRSDDLPEYGRLPVALTPGPPPRPGAQKQAIEEWGRELAAALDQGTSQPTPSSTSCDACRRDWWAELPRGSRVRRSARRSGRC
ncbi:hypothetical protein [Leucobacter soli]|uniref:hypothetical protein n=1 Tax=Leucobacter soli TaxID=2812850 RepID=UPI00361CCAF2